MIGHLSRVIYNRLTLPQHRHTSSTDLLSYLCGALTCFPNPESEIHLPSPETQVWTMKCNNKVQRPKKKKTTQKMAVK